MIQIPIFFVLDSIVQAVTAFWLWLDTVVLVPEFGDGITLLELFIGVVCIDVMMFLVFGFLGWNDGGED